LPEIDYSNDLLILRFTFTISVTNNRTITRISRFLNNRYPQNFILKNPFIGVIIFLAFCFLFVIIYKPLKTHETQFFNFPVTMAVYCFVSSLSIFGLIKILKSINYFSDKKEWSFIKEIISIILMLFGMGVVIYLLAFLMEPPANRYNLKTFLDSCINAFLVGIIPFGFFTVVNYRHLFVSELTEDIRCTDNHLPSSGPSEELIQISSRLKKEELSFYPSQFIYAESDGNYVVFYLSEEDRVKKEVIRNSISDIEQQLSAFPFFARTHRAFIVNLKKIISKKGNTLGYRLKLSDIDSEIPVSRQNTHSFDKLLKQYK
jgi:hypothetical protein